jgi:hypothetical protein
MVGVMAFVVSLLCLKLYSPATPPPTYLCEPPIASVASETTAECALERETKRRWRGGGMSRVAVLSV